VDVDLGEDAPDERGPEHQAPPPPARFSPRGLTDRVRRLADDRSDQEFLPAHLEAKMLQTSAAPNIRHITQVNTTA
jgi:hypothetical protein